MREQDSGKRYVVSISACRALDQQKDSQFELCCAEHLKGLLK